MSEIEIGEYVRTAKGDILKYDEEHDKAFIDNFLVCEYMGEKIVNHKENIIELIKEGDIIEYQKGNYTVKTDVFEDGGKLVIDDLINLKSIREIKIKSIVTKEQFKNIEYKVGD